jgi:hypothetical protein
MSPGYRLFKFLNFSTTPESQSHGDGDGASDGASNGHPLTHDLSCQLNLWSIDVHVHRVKQPVSEVWRPFF